MSDPSQTESRDVRERRLGNAFQRHQKIQQTLDDQEKDRVTDKRYAIVGVVLLTIIVAIAIYFELTSETTILTF